MRDLGQLLNAHLGCTHRTTEVRVADYEFRFRHAGDRYLLMIGWEDEVPDAVRVAMGSRLFHEAVRALLPSHPDHTGLHITDEEYAGILDG